MGNEYERMFWAIRRAMFRQAPPFNNEKDAPSVYCHSKTRPGRDRVQVHGTLDLMEMAQVVVDDLRKHDRGPQLIEDTAKATARHVIDTLLPHVADASQG